MDTSVAASDLLANPNKGRDRATGSAPDRPISETATPSTLTTRTGPAPLRVHSTRRTYGPESDREAVVLFSSAPASAVKGIHQKPRQEGREGGAWQQRAERETRAQRPMPMRIDAEVQALL